MRPTSGFVVPVRASLVAIVLVVVLAACGGGSDKPKDGGAKQPDPATLLNEAAGHMEQVKSFHFALDHEKGTSPIVLGLNMSRAEGDVVRPDRLRADVEAAAGGIGLKLKLVSIGDKVKITNPFNPSAWQDLPSGTKISDVFDPAAGVTSALRNVKDARITGEDSINGVKVWRVEGTVDATALSALATIAESGFTAKGTAWIGQSTPEVYRIRLEGPLGSKDTPEVVRRLELSRFNENIAIDPPPSS
jgi:hypothetical protein